MEISGTFNSRPIETPTDYDHAWVNGLLDCKYTYSEIVSKLDLMYDDKEISIDIYAKRLGAVVYWISLLIELDND